MKKIIGILLLIHPIVLGLLFLNFRWTWGWYSSSYHQWFDLAFAMVSFIGVCAGISLLGMRRPRALMVVLAVFFVFYQVGSLAFKSGPRYAERLELAGDREVLLIQWSGGALASGAVRLVLSEPIFPGLRKQRILAVYDWASQVDLRHRHRHLQLLPHQRLSSVP